MVQEEGNIEITVPREFAKRIAGFRPGVSDAWVERLPGLVAECARLWSLRVGAPCEPLSYNYVATATRADGSRVILKIGVPHRELYTEMEALRGLDGNGCARLLESDRERGAMLLERLAPGHPLDPAADDEAATRIAAGVMRQLWRPAAPGHSLFTLARRTSGLARMRQRYGGGTGPLPGHLVERAEGLFRELLASQEGDLLLHGDLHHGNILSAQRQPWLCIDPKGIVGEPAYDAAVFLLSLAPAQLAQPRPDRILACRAGILVEELGLDRQRLLAWSQAHAILSAWWCIESHMDCMEGALLRAELTGRVIRSEQG